MSNRALRNYYTVFTVIGAGCIGFVLGAGIVLAIYLWW